jgi:hypothetical protein
MQEMLMADALNPELPAVARAQVARAWSELEERKRILRMKPKPKDIDTEKRKAERASKRTNTTIRLDPPPEAVGQ